MNPLQGTITKTLKFAGVGLHSGSLIDLEISPAAPNTGIIFQRSDLDEAPLIAAHPFNVSSTTLCTTIGENEWKIATIEHLMAAFSGLGIDNAYVKVSGPEIPILDGSSAPFYDAISSTGVEVQNAPRRLFIVKKPLELRVDDQWIKVEPSQACLEILSTIDFQNSQAIGKQTFHYQHSFENFSELVEARTFCHIEDVNAMRSVGLAKGGSLDNAVVVNNESVINAEGLRFDNEFVRHKVLDCVGDLAMIGGRLIGKVSMYKGGHTLHVELAKKLLAEHQEYLSIVEDGKLQDQLLANFFTKVSIPTSIGSHFHR